VDNAGEKPLRVGLVIGQLSAGGAENQLRLLCTAPAKREFIPLVYCLSTQLEPHGEALRAAGIPLRVIDGSRLQRLRALRAALAADRIDVVHAWLFIANAFSWLAAAGRPLVTSARNCKRQGTLLDALNRHAFRASSAIVVNSTRVGEYIERVYGAPAKHLRVVYNGLDLERFRPRTEAGPGNAPVVVGIGRLVAQKNPALFVSAARALRERIPAVRFRWIGDGPLRASVAAQIEAAGLAGECTLEGERDDVDEVLRGADLLWLTSDWEGLPNVVMEAMTDVGGTSELFDSGDEGALISAGDQERLVEHSVALLSDVTEYRRASMAARRRAEAFAAPVMIEAMNAVYRGAYEGGEW
jgi:glycosyltransferase involved in cell wall biosynthesis